jgi:MHS family proline/betaine transporter-like MFS transporter
MADTMAPGAHVSRRNLATIIAGSSAGTLIEWYDFYIFASLASVVSAKFFPAEGTLAFLKTLATIWVGFAVRPFGAIFFGHIGDLIGRKYTFLVTLLIMGGATFAIGLLPTYKTLEAQHLGWLAPWLLLALRVLQGLALGGEYGGAATYIAEHCPDGERGYWTSWIQTTATLGLFVSLGVILACRLSFGTDFDAWGWRVPFLLSIVLVIFSYILRMRMKESPLFTRMKASGKASKNPFAESFLNWYNLKYVLIALFGATAGQGVVWYTGQFYALFFLQKTVNIELTQSNIMIGAGLLIATPFFIVMGALSDRIGRKPIILAGCLLAVLTYVPIFHGLANQGDLSTKKLVEGSTSQVGEAKVEKVAGEDKVRGVGAGDAVTTTNYTKSYTDGTTSKMTKTVIAYADASKPAKETSKDFDIKLGTTPMLITIGLIALLVFYVTMVYGPIAAFLVEMFPTRIRYSSMSLPYHIGNGVFGGLVPFAATFLAAIAVKDAATKPDAGPFTKMLNPIVSPLTDLFGGAKYVGLIYPIVIAGLTFIIGLIFIREKRDVRMMDEH